MDAVTRRSAAIACLATALFAAWSAVSAQSTQPLEYAVKAAYLVKFPSYVEWPDSAFPTADSPIALCVVGPDPFGRLLDEASAGQQVHGHPLVVRRMKTITRDSGCHIAFVAADSSADKLAGSGVLVVSDTPAGGGIISFVVQDNRVRFTVDDEAAAQSGLGISSKLLSVALSVRPRAKG
ncbi:YfiR family protein [Piscinibacter sp.]|uniref:YfiR family protein n=1 Tax=Piscinibacter sp. TaxID=1903157 RepID=UPI002CC0C3D3|nr:YfiR family protein [Albitalea sp.]HUG24028.1 YfiR family protein [Albitalea sp.]